MAAEESKDVGNLIEEAEENAFEVSVVFEDRPSIVQELLDSKKQQILSKEQLDRIKFCDMVAAQAKNLVPGTRQLEASAKVKAML